MNPEPHVNYYFCFPDVHFLFILFYFYAFLSRDDENPRRVDYRSTTWTGQTFTTHTALNTEQNQLAIKVSADN